ncbi:MAG: ABC transporter ATP-binding protein [Christensenellaceae bacterium]|jgi:ATP-binding cassette subfamily B multidrug efflux pump
MENRKRESAPMGGGPGGPNQGGGEKAKNFKQASGQLVAFNKKYLPLVIVALVLAMVGSIITIIGPDRVSEMTNIMINGAMAGIDMKEIGRIAISLAVLYGIGAISSYIQGFIMTTVTAQVTGGLRTSISKKINRLPLKYFDNTSFGEVLSRVTNDVDTIGQTLNQSVTTIVSAITLFLGALIMMFVTNWIMAITAVGASLIGFVFMMIIMKRSQKYFMQQQQNIGAMNGHIEEIYSGHNIVKAYNGEKDAQKEFDEINENLRDTGWKSQFFSGLMMPLMSFIGNFGYVAVCVVGGALALNGHISFGVVVAFIMYVRLFTQPLSQMAQAATNMQTAAAASERVFEFLDETEMEDESEKTLRLTDVKGNVSFEHVQFGYEEDRPIIHDFSAEAKAGQKIAIVGPTGAGKTTMVNLLMRFYEVSGGKISIEGTPIEAVTRENVHDQFCMVLQDTWLFEGTIKENIVYSMENVSDEKVVEACKVVGMDRFIRTLPNGYDTMLNDALNLSVGQRQLLTIARAIVKDAPMLILDEATSSVDTRTEVLTQRAMDHLMEGRTSFVIAHRLFTIKNADMILVMRDGDIIENGTHEALLAEGGFYAELYNSQFEQAS